MRSATHSGRPFRARPAATWLMCLFLLLLLTSCAQPADQAPRLEPPPPNLATDCWPGPDWPKGDVPLGKLLEVVRAREQAAAECRRKVLELLRAWPT